MRKHLPFLDGIRGLAALYVVLCHAVWIPAGFGPPPGRTHYLLQPLLYGQVAVAVFIVLSGYCLALPCVSAGPPIRLNRTTFCRRRARRILPPYYAALLLSVAVAALGSQPLGTGDVVSHLLRVHDLRAGWIRSINPPMWSVAVEWHIYFVFAFVSLPVWRRAGVAATVAAAAAVSLLPHFALRRYDLDWAHPWYLILFTFGIVAAVVTEAPAATVFTSVVHAANGALLVVGSALLAVIYAVKARLGDHLFIVTDTLEGLLAALLIVRLARATAGGRRSPTLRFLESPALLALGATSYSLYLFHWPVLSMVDAALATGRSAEVRCWMTLVVGSPIALVAAFVGYLTVERPFLHRRPTAPTPPAGAAKVPGLTVRLPAPWPGADAAAVIHGPPT